jgi:FkbM family methyltransferase
VRILLHTNPPWLATGYGMQAAQLAPRLAAAGHDVAISCMAGLNGRPTTWEGITCLPSGYTAYSNDVLPHHARGFFGPGGRGLVLVIYDAWCVQPDAVRGLATAVWSPVHSQPMSHGDKMFYGVTGAQPVAMSRYGEALMAEFGLQPVYVPHGIDTGVFRPLDDSGRVEARRVLKVDRDAFLIAVVGANKGTSPPRKAWGEQFQAFAQFRKTRRDAILYCHTIAASPHGLDLRPILASLGLDDGSVMFSGDYPQVAGLFTPGYVAGLMGCADVLSNPSYGEGFGLAAVEAQACGTPVVVGDNSAQAELCGAGWRVRCQPYWVAEDSAWWHAPRIDSIVKAWGQAYKRRGDARLRGKAREFALRFDADLVFAQHWKPVLDMLEQYAGAVPVRSQVRNHGAVPLPTGEDDGLRWIIRGHHTGDGLAIAHEDALKPVFAELMPPGGVFLDVGAHVGRWSLRMARRASRVVAVEANPETAAQLRAHIELNGLENVTVLEVAAWDCRDQLTLDDPNRQTSGGSTRVRPGDGGTVEAWRLDELLPGDLDVGLIKLDVEGADLHALRGMAGTISRCRPPMIIERHDIYGYYKLADLEDLLASLGYGWRDVSFPLPDGRSAPYLIAQPAKEEEPGG